MGGVVNVITRQSRGTIGGTRASAAAASARRISPAGSAAACRRASTSTSPATPSISATTIRMGNGVVAAGDQLQDLRRQRPRRRRPVDGWRVDGHVESTAAATSTRRATSSPASSARAARISSASTGDARLSGRMGAHDAVVHRLRRERSQPHLQRHDQQSARSCRSCPICRSKASSAGPALQAKDSWALVAAQQPRARPRLREGHQREPLVRAHRRPSGAVLRRQQQAHGRPLRREHAAGCATAAPSSRSAAGVDRITTETVDDAAQDQLHAVRDARSPCSIRASA